MTKYDSIFERELHAGVLKDWTYHPKTFEFSIPKKYTPDYGFTLGNNTYYIESKGYLYSSESCRSFTEFRRILKPNEELIFCFSNPSVPMKWKTKRKDGSRMTVSQWADVNNFRWYTSDSLFVLLHEIRRENNVKKT